MYTDLALPPEPESSVLLKARKMPLKQRAIFLGSAAYPPDSDLARELVASVASVPYWGELARRRHETLLAEAAEQRRGSKKRSKRKQAPVETANLWLRFEADEEAAATATAASEEAATDPSPGADEHSGHTDLSPDSN